MDSANAVHRHVGRSSVKGTKDDMAIVYYPESHLWPAMVCKRRAEKECDLSWTSSDLITIQGPIPVAALASQIPPLHLRYHPQSQFTVPPVTTDLYDQDDAASARIVRPRHSFAHRLWSTPKDSMASTPHLEIFAISR